jgi:oligosaccharide repeat unit polymerase
LEIIIALSCFIMAWIYTRLIRGVISNPVVIFLLLWGGLFLVYSMRYKLFPGVDFFEVGVGLGLYYLGFFVAFFIGGLTALSFGRLLPKKYKANSKINSISCRNLKSNPPLAVFLSYISFLTAILAVYYAEFSFSDYLSIGSQIRTHMTLDYKPTQNLLSMASSYAAFFTLPISLYMLIINKRRQIWLYLPLVSLFITSGLSLGKYSVIFAIVIAFSIWLIHHGIRSKEIYRLLKPLLLIFSVILVTFIVALTLRSESDNQNKGGYTPLSIGYVVFMYGVGHINTFTNFYESYDSLTGSANTKNAGFGNVDMDRERAPGEVTFSGFYRILYWVGLRESIAYTRYEGLKGFNTSSIIRNYIDDFGLNGAIIASLVTGFLCQLLFIVFSRKTVTNISFLSLVMAFVVFMPIHSLFNFIFYYFTIAAVFVVGKGFSFRVGKFD